MNLILSLILLVLATLCTKIFCIIAQDSLLMDKPNERSMHAIPTIRGGGLVFIGLTLLSLPILCYLNQTPLVEQFVFAFSALLIATISFLDDLYNLSIKPRFLIQMLVALLTAFFMRPEQLNMGLFIINAPFLIGPILFILVLWAINHFNFMDGIDGFCAMQGTFLFASYAILFALHGAIFYESLCWVFIACLVGFLFFNLPPAKIFMGDVGSATLGYVTFALALIAQQKFQIPILYWFMLNGLFLFDATCTLLRRIMKKEKWSAPHRKHAYQRLRQSGITVRMILLGQLIINGSFLILVLNVHVFHSFTPILLQIILIFLIYYLIEKIFPMFQSEITH